MIFHWLSLHVLILSLACYSVSSDENQAFSLLDSSCLVSFHTDLSPCPCCFILWSRCLCCHGLWLIKLMDSTHLFSFITSPGTPKHCAQRCCQAKLELKDGGHSKAAGVDAEQVWDGHRREARIWLKQREHLAIRAAHWHGKLGFGLCDFTLPVRVSTF